MTTNWSAIPKSKGTRSQRRAQPSRPFGAGCLPCRSRDWRATSYTPHIHNLNFLRTQAECLSPKLIFAWPRETRKDRARFEKLKDAYVKARHSKHYRISLEELQWLAEHIEELGRAVHEICLARIAILKADLPSPPVREN